MADPPATIFVCQASGEIALKKYPLRYGGIDGTRQFYFNAEKDTLALRNISPHWDENCPNVPQNDFEQTKRLMLYNPGMHSTLEHESI